MVEGHLPRAATSTTEPGPLVRIGTKEMGDGAAVNRTEMDQRQCVPSGNNQLLLLVVVVVVVVVSHSTAEEGHQVSFLMIFLTREVLC